MIANKLYEVSFRFIFCLWLVMMLNFSGAFSFAKQLLLVVVLAFSLLEILMKKNKVRYRVVLFICIWFILCSISYIHGIHGAFDVSYSLINYVFLTPVICYLISTTLNSGRLLFLNRALYLSFVVALIFSYVYALHIFGFFQIPDALLSSGFFGGVQVGGDILEMRMSNQSALIFLIPYFTMLTIFETGNEKNKYIITLAFSLLIVLISGRRALQILVLIGGVLTYLVYVISSKSFIKVLLNSIVVMILSTLSLFLIFHIIHIVTQIENPVSVIYKTILLAFDPSQKSTSVRSEQVVHLLNFWNDSPVFGHGLNSHPQYLRSVSDKWSYEYVYLAFIAENGLLLGLYFFSSFFISWFKMWNLYKIKNVHSKIFISLFCGSICFVIAAGTNPMIQFYWFWVLFLIPFGFSHNKVIVIN